MASENLWLQLPQNVVFTILQFLEPLDIARTALVCKDWFIYGKDDVLWRKKFCAQFHLPLETNETGLDTCSSRKENVETTAVKQEQSCSENKFSWYKEFQRLHCQTPCLVLKTIDDHTDEVLHVAFAHNGKYIATCSRDCFAGVYNVDGLQVDLLCKLYFGDSWSYVQYAEFSPDDQYLLISGVKISHSFGGDTAVYHLQDGQPPTIVNKVLNEPYDVFGTWLDGDYFLVGEFKFAHPFGDNSFSELWAHHTKDNYAKKILSVKNSDQSSVRMISVTNRSSLTFPQINPLGYEKKTIVYTYGTVSYTPHQVVIQEILWPPSKHEESCTESVESQGHNGVRKIETSSHIIGMDVSPDKRYLYVNCRPWTQEEIDFRDPPEIANDIELRVYDMQSLELLMTHIGHQSFTKNTECFFIFVNASDSLVASGAEDKLLHIWDRHHGCKVATLPGHKDVVNAVAFNPENQEMLVSASDDHTVKIWVSRNLMRMHRENNTVSSTSQKKSEIDDSIDPSQIIQQCNLIELLEDARS